MPDSPLQLQLRARALQALADRRADATAPAAVEVTESRDGWDATIRVQPSKDHASGPDVEALAEALTRCWLCADEMQILAVLLQAKGIGRTMSQIRDALPDLREDVAKRLLSRLRAAGVVENPKTRPGGRRFGERIGYYLTAAYRAYLTDMVRRSLWAA